MLFFAQITSHFYTTKMTDAQEFLSLFLVRFYVFYAMFSYIRHRIVEKMQE